MYTVLLYYKFVKVDDPQALRDAQYELCKRLGLKGRILVGKEGLNGTVCGLTEATEEYKRETLMDERFADMVFKESEGEEDTFPKLRVVVRDEIVTLGAGEEGSADNPAPYISADELHELLQSGEEYYLLDGRNEYESRIGKFMGAIAPEVDNFREFPEYLKKLEHLKDKKVITYCTGGIRCEKLSAYMLRKGFKNVYQLDGGIVTYGEKYKDGSYEGKCYVFDKRRAVDINDPEHERIISTCVNCGAMCARYIDCADPACNEQVICCAECEEIFHGMCNMHRY